MFCPTAWLLGWSGFCTIRSVQQRQGKSNTETVSFQEQQQPWTRPISLETLLAHLGNDMGASSSPPNSLFPNSVLLLHASLKQEGTFTKSWREILFEKGKINPDTKLLAKFNFSLYQQQAGPDWAQGSPRAGTPSGNPSSYLHGDGGKKN